MTRKDDLAVISDMQEMQQIADRISISCFQMLGLSKRASMIIVKNNIKNDDLAKMSYDEIFALSNCGKETALEIVSFIDEYLSEDEAESMVKVVVTDGKGNHRQTETVPQDEAESMACRLAGIYQDVGMGIKEVENGYDIIHLYSGVLASYDEKLRFKVRINF